MFLKVLGSALLPIFALLSVFSSTAVIAEIQLNSEIDVASKGTDDTMIVSMLALIEDDISLTTTHLQSDPSLSTQDLPNLQASTEAAPTDSQSTVLENPAADDSLLDQVIRYNDRGESVGTVISDPNELTDSLE